MSKARVTGFGLSVNRSHATGDAAAHKATLEKAKQRKRPDLWVSARSAEIPKQRK